MPHNNRRKPNVVLIVMDATRADHLSCYGYSCPTTPNIDKIAEDGVIYENAFSPAIWTLPSVASLFTGLFPSQHGANLGHRYLDASYLTLPEMLRAQGYQTAAFSCNPWVSSATGLARGFEQFDLVGQLWQAKELNRLQALIQRFYWSFLSMKYDDRGTKRVYEKAIRWLKRERDEQRPFFLFVMSVDPHFPIKAPEPFRSKFLPEGISPARLAKVPQDVKDIYANRVRPADDEWQILRSLYDGAVNYLDVQIGSLVYELDDLVDPSETVLFILSDHGECIGDHGLLGHHYCLYDSLVHVPLIARYPDRASPKRGKISNLVQSHEIIATLAWLTGYDDSDAGKATLLPQDIDNASREYVYSEYLEPHLSIFDNSSDFDPSFYDRALRSIRTATHKYIWASDGRSEFYDLRDDPGELNNLIRSGSQLAEELKEVLLGWVEDISQSGTVVGEAQELDEILVKRLKDLGYL